MTRNSRLSSHQLAAITFSTVCGLGPAAGAVFAPSWTVPIVSFGERYQGPLEVPEGLRYCTDFVTAAEEEELLSVIDGPGSRWMRYIRRAQQFFGLVYYQTSQAVPELQPTAESPSEAQLGRQLEDLPSWLLPRIYSTQVHAEGADINQVQANEYLEDSGIGLHVEDPAAGPAFTTLSLLQPVQMTLQRAKNGRPLHRDERHREDCVKVLLEPRSLLVLSGSSRSEYAHAIRQSKLVRLREGGVLRRDAGYRRVSLTFRAILTEQRSVQRADMPDGYKSFQLPHTQDRMKA